MSWFGRRQKRFGQLRSAWLALGAVAWIGCQFPDYAYRDTAGAGASNVAGANSSGASAVGGAATAGENASGAGNSAGAVAVAGGGVTSGSAGAANNGGAGTSGAGTSGAGTSGAGTSSAGASSAGAAGAAGSNGENVVLSDDFEAGSGQWLAVAGTGWAVVNDATQGKVYTQTPLLNGFYAAVAKSGPWKDQIVEAKLKISKFGGSATSDVAQIFGRFSDIDNYYSAGFRPDGRVAIRGSVAGSVASIKTSEDINIKTGVWYSVRFSLIGDVLRFYVDDVVRAQAVDGRITQGTVALGGDNTLAVFDDVRVTLP